MNELTANADRPRGPKPSETENHLNGDNTDPSRVGVGLFDLAAERATIGAALVTREALAILCKLLCPDDFYRRAYRAIATVLIDAYREGWPADIVTVSDRLQSDGIPVDIDILSEAVDGCPHASAARFYAAIVKKRSLQRMLVAAGDEIGAVARRCRTADEALAEAEKILADVWAASRRPAP